MNLVWQNSCFIFKLKDEGEIWVKISPNRNDWILIFWLFDRNFINHKWHTKLKLAMPVSIYWTYVPLAWLKTNHKNANGYNDYYDDHNFHSCILVTNLSFVEYVSISISMSNVFAVQNLLWKLMILRKYQIQTKGINALFSIVCRFSRKCHSIDVLSNFLNEFQF